MMNLIKLKVKSASNFKEKIHWLTVTPLSWNLSTLKREFNLNYSTAKYAKKIQNLYGFGSYPPAPSTRRTFTSENIEKIINFYTSDEISRVMPGQKDCLSVQQEDGKKIKLQKRLILCNLKEAYVAFKSLYPEIKVGFSKFASLRPKQCVLADSNGTHTVCVCKIHQNFKLMLNGLKSIFEDISVTTYEEIIECMICSKPKNECYMKQCDLCPGFHEIATEIEEALKKRNIINITYQLWTNTDRSSLETITEEAKIFLKKMGKEADILLVHNFVAKEQSNFLKNLKTNLKEGELIVIGDFSENFTFLIQNAIQSHHWNNSQTTIHPFVIYRPERDHNNSLKFESFVLISESTEHSTEAVYLFQSRLISFIKENYGSDKIKKIIISPMVQHHSIKTEKILSI